MLIVRFSGGLAIKRLSISEPHPSLRLVTLVVYLFLGDFRLMLIGRGGARQNARETSIALRSDAPSRHEISAAFIAIKMQKE